MQHSPRARSGKTILHKCNTLQEQEVGKRFFTMQHSPRARSGKTILHTVTLSCWRCAWDGSNDESSLFLQKGHLMPNALSNAQVLNNNNPFGPLARSLSLSLSLSLSQTRPDHQTRPDNAHKRKPTSSTCMVEPESKKRGGMNSSNVPGS